ncbi:hypothetical protein BVX97_03575 [bacterium E08(2017)]|nr:hypothetical protein BVX97_03575 [bacterium E08(2017)]
MSHKIIKGNEWRLDGGVMFGNAPKSLWTRWVEPDDMNRVKMASNCLLVQNDDKTVLIDAGISPFMDPKIADRYGIQGSTNELIENLAAEGISCDEVDYVILTHVHFDHIGGLMPVWPDIKEPDSELHFKNAIIVLNKRQFERAFQPHPRDRASYFGDILTRIKDCGRLMLLDDGEQIPELESFITIETSDGHTPGLMMPLVKDGDDTIFYPSDLISGAPWVHLPIVTGLDRAPEQLIDEKRTYLDRAIEGDWVVVFDHDATTPCAKIAFDEEKKRYLASID